MRSGTRAITRRSTSGNSIRAAFPLLTTCFPCLINGTSAGLRGRIRAQGLTPTNPHGFYTVPLRLKKLTMKTLWNKWGECLRTDGGYFTKTAFADYAAYYVDGSIDQAALYSFGAVDSIGSVKTRWNLFTDKLKAIITTIKDWLRKLSTGDLL